MDLGSLVYVDLADVAPYFSDDSARTVFWSNDAEPCNRDFNRCGVGPDSSKSQYRDKENTKSERQSEQMPITAKHSICIGLPVEASYKVGFRGRFTPEDKNKIHKRLDGE